MAIGANLIDPRATLDICSTHYKWSARSHLQRELRSTRRGHWSLLYRGDSQANLRCQDGTRDQQSVLHDRLAPQRNSPKPVIKPAQHNFKAAFVCATLLIQ